MCKKANDTLCDKVLVCVCLLYSNHVKYCKANPKAKYKKKDDEEEEVENKTQCSSPFKIVSLVLLSGCVHIHIYNNQ